MTGAVLHPALPAGQGPLGPLSRWVGELDRAVAVHDGLTLLGSEGFARARLLVRHGDVPLGFVDVPVERGRVTSQALTLALAGADLRPATETGPPQRADPVSVILSTRDRPESLRVALASLLVMDHDAFEVVVVDNASTTDATAGVVRALHDPRVRLVVEPRPGLARARNRGVLAARHPVVAFTDDDVVVDRAWLRGLARGFAAAPRVACVCGMVPSGELRTFAQVYFDERVSWARSCAPQVYDLGDPPSDQPLFPFGVGRFGTGANFAMRRDVVPDLGGFDEALGVGSPTRGGEDIDMFVRVLLGGHRLAYEPSALVWHRHRSDPEALREQIAGYGVGLGAWIGKLLVDRRTAPMVLRRGARALAHARRMTRVDLSEAAAGEGARHLAALELGSALTGPYRYAQARARGARPHPLGPAP